jgi:hypothetical protein
MTTLHAQEISGTFIPDDADKPRSLAEIFHGMFGNEQAQFFNYLAVLDRNNPFPGAGMFGDERQDHLNESAREMLRRIADDAPKPSPDIP